ncbi:cytochrome c biogenesis protein CcmG, thiol:disulfide interchange protein DsbE [Altererythrobacter xiamenensis]|uniref:Cytochrome c biogenesis protein CcmG, thiol:disulfide interchange protein DsbE n=1 Tax=Altererythrobacter xiamenensis TaxID=1316679 RepID=A0A1Y6FGS8_9SPHN|nr:DsbE family thiol:disulfide interchange protein [Altererythrobacter xiamenensis]SMQ73889.1 cytochrome c biogenesis protein CcmG, thiol:disulfide interchange protein DsbE [Altererythrobacter xiamenensis]
MRWTLWVPLALFAFFLGLAAYQLSQPKDEFVPSTMIGKPLPEFDLRPATEELPGVALEDFKDGTPRLLNIWASWCLPCIAEAPHLEALNEAGVEIFGVAIRDKPEDVTRFLETHGNPYTRIGADDLSALQLEIGSSGVPETFVIDGNGIIRYQHIGDVREDDVPMLLEKLREAGE